MLTFGILLKINVLDYKCYLHPEMLIYGSFHCNTLPLNDPRYILRYSVYSLVFNIACAYSTVARKLLLDDVVIIQLLSIQD